MKRDFNFTKGPWRLTPWVEGQKAGRVAGPNGEPIALVNNVREEGVANQQLITASPEMLYAIDEAVRVFGKNTSNMNPDEFGAFEELKRVHNLARMGRES
jgi:hypothetical protein